MVPSHINENNFKPASSRLTYCSTLYWATLTDEKYFNNDIVEMGFQVWKTVKI